MARDEAYRKAEERIEEARRLKATEFHLRGLKLTELPASLGQLTELQSLILSGNQLTYLPEFVTSLTKLETLILSGNQLKSLPESIGQLGGLRSLKLWDNKLSNLPEAMGQLIDLQSLDLSDNHLSSLPESIGGLGSMQQMDLSDNQLGSLPESLGGLVNLRGLDLSDNGLRLLPESIGQLENLESLDLSGNQLRSLPKSIGQLTRLRSFKLRLNQLESVSESIGRLSNLQSMDLSNNQLRSLPESVGRLASLEVLEVRNNQLTSLPESVGQLARLQNFHLSVNRLTSLPETLGWLIGLRYLGLEANPLEPELVAVSGEGIEAIKRYLRAKAEAQIVLNEAKLILVGEGEVGKSCLLGALRGDGWIEDRPTTHGIEIKPVQVTDPANGTEITLNGWNFGGQRVYRPTHQLFFSAPAVYLVVWKPREGPQQGFVKEWISLVKHREPDAKILVVATHGGPGQRQPDVDRQEIWDLFGRQRVLDFFHVDSKPDEKTGERYGTAKLKEAIAQVAASLPEVGRKVPARWQHAREALKEAGVAYLPLEKVLEICRQLKMDAEESRLFVTVSHQLGHLIHYEHDPTLRDIVVLKPDWLATAISFVLDDKQTRDAHGLVSFARLGELWDNPARKEEFRYSSSLHPVFLRLMERFDLSYRVAGLSDRGKSEGTSLIAQLVPDIRPEQDLNRVWSPNPAEGDEQQVQICRIVDAKSGQSATAEGLFYQLIVRLHKFSLGRVNYEQSVHWQRGLVLDDNYNGRALLEHVGDNICITIRAAYPERFLSALTYEVKWLVESSWAGLRCDVMVPCLEPCGRFAPGTGLFEVQKLIESKKRQRPDYPCPVCDEWQSIDFLLRNAPAAQRMPVDELLAEFAEVKSELSGMRELLIIQHGEAVGRFDKLDIGSQRILSKVDDAFARLIQALTEEAKDGPRLFSFQPVDPKFFDRPKWINQKFRLTLWCEHSRLPLPALSKKKGDRRGVYDLNLPRDWFVKAGPFLKVLTGTLSLVLPIASSATKLVLDEGTYKGIEKELDLGQKSLESVFKGGERVGDWLSRSDAPDLKRGEAFLAQGAILRQLHVWLKEKDPGFGGLVRVRNKRQEILWVHPQFEKEY